MKRDDDLRLRPGRIRDRSGSNSKLFVARVLASAEKSGGISIGRRRNAPSSFGRGRAAAFGASQMLTSRSRAVVIKARVVRHGVKATPLSAHLTYLRREGVTKDGEPARMFGATTDDASAREFAERCQEDRHHFRFIVSPDDAAKMTDLRAFARDLLTEMERDLSTKLDWVAVDHWNTEHPHVHLIVRGKTDEGRDLVMARDYVAKGIRARAEHLVTLEIGSRSDNEVRRDLDAQVEADRWTKLDRALSVEAARKDGVIDLRFRLQSTDGSESHLALIGRMRKLERLGLAAPTGSAQWQLKETAEQTLRAIGERHDIIKRIHRGLIEQRIERSVSEFAFDDAGAGQPVVGRLVSRGLDDELKGSAYAVVDGVDGRTHHIRLGDLNETSDATPGAIVELRRFEDATGRRRSTLAVRSDLALAAQMNAQGATWVDWQLVAREPDALGSGGFGREVREAKDERVEHLIGEGLARRQGQRVIFVRDLLDTLRQREIAAATRELAIETGLVHCALADGETVNGVYRRRLTLASGRFAMLDDGLGFRLVPWKPSLERHLGRQVSGLVHPRGIVWTFDRSGGPSIG
jgi:type IV secretory pathway VirD2 relaxase